MTNDAVALLDLSSVICYLSCEGASGEFARPMTFDVLEFATLVVTGFTSCAEFGSYAFVYPVIRRLPPEHHVFVEKGLLRTQWSMARSAT